MATSALHMPADTVDAVIAVVPIVSASPAHSCDAQVKPMQTTKDFDPVYDNPVLFQKLVDHFQGDVKHARRKMQDMFTQTIVPVAHQETADEQEESMQSNEKTHDEEEAASDSFNNKENNDESTKIDDEVVFLYKRHNYFEIMRNPPCFPFDFDPLTDSADYMPTMALPGSREKLDVLARRLECGVPLWHPEDRIDCDNLSDAAILTIIASMREEETNAVRSGAKKRNTAFMKKK